LGNRKNILLVVNDNPIDPLGVMYLAGNVDANFDVLFVKDQYDKRLNDIDISKYDICGLSTITGSHLVHNEIAKYFKDKGDILTLMGGPHPTFFPRESLGLSHIDYICMGEGTVALERFVHGEETNNIINDYKQYRGALDPIADIDKLKIDRGVVYKIGNRAKNPIRNFMGTFGCPFNCSYCFNFSYNKLYEHQGGKRVRYMEPELFVGEMKECVRDHDTRFLYIQDDIFVLNKKWFNRVADLIKQEIDLPYHCHVRIDVLTEQTAKKLKDTGCYSVTFAIEDADEGYREKYLNRKVTNKKILENSRLLRDHGIEFRIENMVGLPFNSLRDNMNTLDINYRCHPTIGWASLFQPFTNTELGNICREEGLWSGNIDDIDSGFFNKSPLKIKNRVEVERLQKLFSLGVDSAFMKFLIPLLVRLPLGRFYDRLYSRFKNKKYDKLYSYG